MPPNYPPTLLRVGLYTAGGYVKVDVRYSLRPALFEELHRLSLEPPWAVMAIEPLGPKEPIDQERTVALLDELEEGPFPYLRSTMAGSRETYEIKAVAVALPLEDAIELAGRYGRGFLFWFDGEAFWYVPVPESASLRVRLPVGMPEWRPRLVQEQRLEGVKDPGGIDGEEEGPPALRLIT